MRPTRFLSERAWKKQATELCTKQDHKQRRNATGHQNRRKVRLHVQQVYVFKSIGALKTDTCRGVVNSRPSAAVAVSEIRRETKSTERSGQIGTFVANIPGMAVNVVGG